MNKTIELINAQKYWILLCKITKWEKMWNLRECTKDWLIFLVGSRAMCIASIGSDLFLKTKNIGSAV